MSAKPFSGPDMSDANLRARKTHVRPGGRDTPANETPARVATYNLRLHYVLSIGWLAMLGLMAWVMIRLPRKEQILWPLFGGGMAFSAALGTWWWAL